MHPRRPAIHDGVHIFIQSDRALAFFSTQVEIETAALSLFTEERLGWREIRLGGGLDLGEETAA